MWTRFHDMHSGGGLKESPYSKIFIEAPEEEAKIIFQNRFGHNPERVTCTCCGEDYSIESHESLNQLTGYDRNCRNLQTPRDPETGLYMNGDPTIKAHYYLEKGDEPPAGYVVEQPYGDEGRYQTLGEYLALPNVLMISAGEIKPEWRKGELRRSGYVWVD